MDLLFARYADPFSFVDGMIQAHRFNEFVLSFWRTVNEEKEESYNWEFFLHRVMDESYGEFRERIKTFSENQNLNARTLETTINESFNILKKLSSEKGGEA